MTCLATYTLRNAPQRSLGRTKRVQRNPISAPTRNAIPNRPGDHWPSTHPCTRAASPPPTLPLNIASATSRADHRIPALLSEEPARPRTKQRQLPLLRIQPHEGAHNRLQAADLVRRIAGVELAALDPLRVALPTQGEL